MHYFTEEDINRYRKYLQREEYGEDTIKKYLRDIHAFAAWAEGSKETETERRTALNKEAAVAWKSHLTEERYAPVTINSMLSALNGFLRFMGWEECRVKFLKVQRRLFRDKGRELSRRERSGQSCSRENFVKSCRITREKRKSIRGRYFSRKTGRESTGAGFGER